jgi:DNA modification methylase
VSERLTDSVTLYAGDCIDVLKQLEPNSLDACVTDPPYGLGFMGKAWDHGVPGLEYWREVFRVLKPGAHLLAFGGTRTFGRMHVAIEDAGFEIRDMVAWVYGSGFPKSLDVSKAIDKAAGAEREVVGISPHAGCRIGGRENTYKGRSEYRLGSAAEITAAATDAARQWQGFGTALKPALEPICLARKPLIGTVAENVLKHGTGALNIDACRVESGDIAVERNDEPSQDQRYTEHGASNFAAKPGRRMQRQKSNRVTWEGGAASGFKPDHVQPTYNANGRWPANVIHDGSAEVVDGFPDTVVNRPSAKGLRTGVATFHEGGSKSTEQSPFYDDSGGSAARFFYTAKADADDRLGSKHPTVKPLDLMQYLVRLVAPKGSLILDPFAGTGTTGEACIREGMRAILIEREPEYQDDIRRRMKLAMAGPDERKRESMKAAGKIRTDFEPGSLFA